MATGQPTNRIEVEEQSSFHDWFKALDEQYLKPLFGGRPPGGDHRSSSATPLRHQPSYNGLSSSPAADASAGTEVVQMQLPFVAVMPPPPLEQQQQQAPRGP